MIPTAAAPGGAIPPPPWVAELRGLWSLPEMIELLPLDFWNLVHVVTAPSLLAKRKPAVHAIPHGVASAVLSAVTADTIDMAAHVMEQLGLSVSFEAANRVAFKLRYEHHEYPTAAFLTDIENLHASVRNELGKRRFAYIKQPNDSYFEQERLFGEAVYVSFPEIRTDIKDAGNCIAAELYTAAVYHLMRVSEFGLRRLARKLRVTLKDKNKPCLIEYATWDKVITGCKSRITKAQAKSAGPKKQSELERYADAADHGVFMKDIWRNNMAHARKPYTEPEAVAAYGRVRDFMAFLAENL
jgi:hypothetical protein